MNLLAKIALCTSLVSTGPENKDISGFQGHLNNAFLIRSSITF